MNDDEECYFCARTINSKFDDSLRKKQKHLVSVIPHTSSIWLLLMGRAVASLLGGASAVRVKAIICVAYWVVSHS